MKLTVSKMFDAEGSLGRLGALTQLPEKIMYKVYKMLKVFDDAMKPITDTNMQLHKKHGGVQIGNQIVVPPDKLQGFAPEREKFMEEEVEIDVKKLSIELKHLRGISPTDLLVLEPFVEVIGVE